MELLFLLLFVCYTSYACNRKSVALSLPSLKAEGTDTSHAGLILSSQNVAFAASKFLAGVLSDRLDPALLFGTGLFLGGFSAIAFAASSSTPLLCALWFLNGLAQGCGWPAIAKILRQRAPPSRFGTLWSLMSSSINVAGCISPIAAALVIARWGWRWNVFLTGSLSVVLGVLFFFFLPFAWKPADSGERENRPQRRPDRGRAVADLFSDPFTWLLSASFLVIFSARTTAVDWGQLYLMEQKGHSQFTASAFTSSVETGGFVGRIMAGYLTDWVIRRNAGKQTRSSVRLSVGVFFLLGSLAAVHCFTFAVTSASSAAWILSIGAVMGFSFYGIIAILGIVAAESIPPHLSGSSNAVVSLFGNIGAVLAGLPFSYVAKYYGWSSIFLLVEVLVAVNFLLLFLFRNRTPKLAQLDRKED